MNQHIENLIHYEIQKGVIQKRDYIYVKNQIYHLLNLTPSEDQLSYNEIQHPSEALEPILDILVQKKVIKNSIVERDLFDAKIMNIFASLPSVVEEKFYTLRTNSQADAIAYLYNYAKSLNYIRYDRILKNKSFVYNTDDITLQITINLSKPEKDPKDINAASKLMYDDYPKCVLCKENEGFSGNLKRDSRDQHRLIKLKLNQEVWYFQYSPYIYYNEHAIVLSEKHTPMQINQTTFENLFALVDQFDGYFFGSNADLPIVGGSILSHDHYQGGKHKFPIEDAKVLDVWHHDGMILELLKWPLSTIRLKGSNTQKLVLLAEKIRRYWSNYSNENINIMAYTNNTPHNTITPIARFKNGYYEMDLILRNNRTTVRYPYGIFHPHEDKHHIKKENIGLIEAIGLAILPSRLISAIEGLKVAYFNQKPLSDDLRVYQGWFNNIQQYQALTRNNFDEVIENEIGKVFESVLLDCGVFKSENIDDFRKFIEDIIQ